MKFHYKPLTKLNIRLLYTWLGLPHVAAWWRESRDFKKFSDKYANWIESDSVGPYLICHGQKPMGYIQWYSASADPHRVEKYPPNTFGIDLFIADLTYVGKGFGADIIQQFIKQVIMPMKPYKIITDPEISNERAIRVYEKAGFKKAYESTATDGNKTVKAVIMELS